MAGNPVRPSSYMRLSTVADLYGRYAAAEEVFRRRRRQLDATEAELVRTGVTPPPRTPISLPKEPCPPAQFSSDSDRRRERSTELVRKAVKRLKLGACRSRSPTKAEVVAMTRDPSIDPEGKGISKNVFRTNQDCLQILLDACLPFDAERRRQTTAPSWATRMNRQELIALVIGVEAKVKQLASDLMAANELLLGTQIASIRRDVVRAKSQRMIESVA
jgi:hypothetical protein